MSINIRNDIIIGFILRFRWITTHNFFFFFSVVNAIYPDSFGGDFFGWFFFLVAVTRNTNSLMLSLSRSSGYALCESVILELLEKIAFRLLLSKSVAKCEMLHNFYVHTFQHVFFFLHWRHTKVVEHQTKKSAVDGLGERDGVHLMQQHSTMTFSMEKIAAIAKKKIATEFFLLTLYIFTTCILFVCLFAWRAVFKYPLRFGRAHANVYGFLSSKNHIE